MIAIPDVSSISGGMMRYIALTVVGILLVLSGCATQKVPQATGGSRADGTVKLSFEYGIFERPEVQWDQAQKSAEKRCRIWGYDSADRFDGGTSQCLSTDNNGNCMRTMVTITYQCVGSPS